jgi:hypothetical protein
MVLDFLRMEAEFMFADIAKMHFTQTNIINLLYNYRRVELPSLPAAALPADADRDVYQISDNPSEFMEAFLDPDAVKLKKSDNGIYVPPLI